jgi:D-serine deaminase-like pyridoxal phosphate-dependent protein
MPTPLPRRTFLAQTAALAGASLVASSRARATAAPITAPDDAIGRHKSELPTPALLVDLDTLDANIAKMAAHCRTAGCAHRPHAKTHKCPEIARRQIAAGASGVCCATVGEAEAMVAAGVRGVLLTSPTADPRKLARMVALVARAGDTMLSLGHALAAERLSAEAKKRGVTVDVLIDLDVGDHRTGITPGEPALALARTIAKLPGLRLRGLQAYSGAASHTAGFEKRRAFSRAALAPAVETRAFLRRAGFDAPLLSGGSTGTYNIDPGEGGLNELQVGSYIFMDVNYRVIGGQSGAPYTDFAPSLTVLTTVVNTSPAKPDQVVIDAGTKAFSSDSSDKPEPRDGRGLIYRRFGDEFGALTAAPGAALPALGDRLEFLVPHCDPTVNLYDRLHAMRGEKVEAVWPIMARRG